MNSVLEKEGYKLIIDYEDEDFDPMRSDYYFCPPGIVINLGNLKDYKYYRYNNCDELGILPNNNLSYDDFLNIAEDVDNGKYPDWKCKKVEAYIHGSIALSLTDVGKKHYNDMFDSGVAGYLLYNEKLISNTISSNIDIFLNKLIEVIEAYFNGEVYKYLIIDKYTQEFCDIVGGFYDYDECLSYAKTSMDNLIKQYPEKERKIYECIYTINNEDINKFYGNISDIKNELSQILNVKKENISDIKINETGYLSNKETIIKYKLCQPLTGQASELVTRYYYPLQ